MRIKNTIKNSLFAISSYIILAVLTIFVRKVFLATLPIELLGYEGLFGNVLSLIALADLGIESLILYRLFPAFAKENHDAINRLMRVYKLLYKYIGIAVLVIGIALVPFLRIIISENNLDWNYVYLIYAIHLVTSLCTYFLAYKRLLFSVSQEEYECTIVDTGIAIVFNGIRLAVLIVFKSYFLYLFCSLGTNLLSNIIISRKVNRRFRYLDLSVKASAAEIRSLEIGKDIKNNIVQKVCGTIYGGTDSIVVSAMLGITQAGLLANYLLIQTYVTTFFTKLLRPFQMSIGNFVHSEEQQAGEKLFRMFDFISYMFASAICACYLNLFNPTITVFFGKQYLLDMGFVIAFACNQYIAWNHQFLTYYRYSFGRYELDKWPFFIAAVLNVVLSIALCRRIGIAGIMIGTVVGHLGIWVGRVKVVYTEYIKENVWRYIERQALRLLTCAGLCFLTGVICRRFSTSIWGLFLRLVVCLAVVVGGNMLLYIKTEEIKDVYRYIAKTIGMLAHRKKRQ